MTFDEYQKSIMDTLGSYIRDMQKDDRYAQLALGLYEEGAEVTSIIRKSQKKNYHEKSIDESEVEHLKEEIGDVLWYISYILLELDCNLSDVARKNLEKTHCIYSQKLCDMDEISWQDYESGVSNTFRSNLPQPEAKTERGCVFALGLAKEIGKITELFGEHNIDGTILNKHKVIEKLGDTLWYLSAIGQNYGIHLQEAAELNTRKAHERYNPDGTVRTEDQEL